MSVDEELNYLNDIPIIGKSELLRLSSGASCSNSSIPERSSRFTEEIRKPTFSIEKDTKNTKDTKIEPVIILERTIKNESSEIIERLPVPVDYYLKNIKNDWKISNNKKNINKSNINSFRGYWDKYCCFKKNKILNGE